MIVAATGLQRERRIVAGGDVHAIAGGGDHARLEALLEGLAFDAWGFISIGIAGGLAPELRTGDWAVADTVLVHDEPVPTDREWTRRIASRLPSSTMGSIIGRNAIVAEPSDKAGLHRATGAIAVDMESHIVAQVARRHRLPFTAARVVCDAAHRTLPPAAQLGMKSDGRMDLMAVLRSLLGDPRQLPTLLQTGIDAQRAFKALLRGYRRLGPRLGGPDLREFVLDMP
jgi:adenosylhomocysteine nucleosidase